MTVIRIIISGAHLAVDNSELKLTTSKDLVLNIFPIEQISPQFPFLIMRFDLCTIKKSVPDYALRGHPIFGCHRRYRAQCVYEVYTCTSADILLSPSIVKTHYTKGPFISISITMRPLSGFSLSAVNLD